MTPAALALWFVLAPAVAQQFSSLEERMTVVEFRKAGLDKLTPDQLRYLDDWLRAHQAGTVAAATPMQPQAQVQAPQSTPLPQRSVGDQPRAQFSSHIQGRFEGWSGRSVFTLANGEVWKQAESGSYSCPTLENPQVTVKPMVLGSWLMYVQGCSQSLRVERVK